MSVIARRFASIPERTAIETWKAISALLASDPKSAAARELASVAGIACSLITREAMTSPLVAYGAGPRVRVYCLYNENAVEGDDANESGLAFDVTDGDWKPKAPRTARRLLKKVEPSLRSSVARRLIRHVLDMEKHREGQEPASPSKLIKQVPGLEEFLSDADEPGPGCLISWYESDEIGACFDEEMEVLGQNAPMEPSALLTMPINKRQDEVDAGVKRVFSYVAAMFRSLASAAKIVAIIIDRTDFLYQVEC